MTRRRTAPAVALAVVSLLSPSVLPEVSAPPALATSSPAADAARSPTPASPPLARADVEGPATAAWGWPLAGTPEVMRGYDPPPRRWLPGHRGIDLAGVAGEPVLAVDRGVVSYSGQIAGVGIVSVAHASGLRSTYQPVVDRATEGTRLGRGEQLGVLDVGGHCVLVDCLHLGARRGNDYVDPTPLLRPLVLSLLPLGRRHLGP